MGILWECRPLDQCHHPLVTCLIPSGRTTLIAKVHLNNTNASWCGKACMIFFLLSFLDWVGWSWPVLRGVRGSHCYKGRWVLHGIKKLCILIFITRFLFPGPFTHSCTSKHTASTTTAVIMLSTQVMSHNWAHPFWMITGSSVSPVSVMGVSGVLTACVGASLQARSRLLCCLASCSMVSSRWVRCSRSCWSTRCHLRLWLSARSKKSRHAWAGRCETWVKHQHKYRRFRNKISAM